MKPVISYLSHHNVLFFFPALLFLRSKRKFYILLFLGMIILAGCFRKFYSTGTVTHVESNTIEQLKTADKFFIIHYTDSVLQLSNVSINNDVLTGKSGELIALHSLQLNPKMDKPNHFKSATRAAVLSEVHLYVNNKKAATVDYPEVKVPLADIYRMDVYQFDKARTTTSTVISIVGIVAASVGIGLIIGAAAAPAAAPAPATEATGCGCPQVYVERQGNFDFQNGIFSGALYANLERTDYLPLENAGPENSVINLRITGHDNEIQYLNSAKLIAVSHRPGSTVLPDRFGKFYSITTPEPPQAAMGQDKSDLKDILTQADGNAFAFSTYDQNKDFSSAYLTFRRPLEDGKAKLLIRAKNSGWAAMVNKEFTLLFGEKYLSHRDYVEKTGKNKTESFLLEQGLPMKVYIENGKKWEYAGYFPLTGTEGYRDMVMELNLPHNKDQQVHIKLESVYRFWDLDYVAIDYGSGEILQATTLDLVSAKHSIKGDQRENLVKNDKTYSELTNDEAVDLEFRVPENSAGNAFSYFLAAGGYYHDQKTYPVKANISRLKRFSRAAEFDRFSREKYNEMESLRAIANQKTQN